MSKKLTWEVEKTSLVLRVADGAKETTWKIRKTAKADDLRQIFEEIQLALWVPTWEPITGTKPMFEAVRTVDAEELAELQRYKAVQATSEEASRAAQAARVAQLNIGAKWFEAEDDIYPFDSAQVQDYDTGAN